MADHDWRSDWMTKKILFVSGKGGVGKSLVAAAVAAQAAREGRRTLLVELGETSYFKDFWNLDSVTHEPRPAPGGFDLALWSGETCLREYVLHYLKMEKLYSVFFENRVMRALINVAPGLAEIAMLGKITSGIRRVGPSLDYDLIVVDCFATGHALALLRAPQGFGEAVKFGPMGTHSREIDAIIHDGGACAYWAVTLLEELPVTETLEFVRALRDDLGLASGVIGNKAVGAPVAADELARLANEERGPVAEFAGYLLAVTKRQAAFAAAFSSEGWPYKQIPMIYSGAADDLVEAAREALRTS